MKNKISERVKLVDVALGNTPPDAVIRGGNLVNVNTREIHKADVVIKGRRVAAVALGESDYAEHATTVINADGQYLVPGFIDPHIHLESSSVTVTELARAIVPRGVTAVVEDPHEIANVLGVRGIELFLEESKNVPLNFFLRVPGKVPPNHNIETAGGEISLKETIELLNREEAAQLAGDINPSVILGKDLVHFEKIDHTISLKKTVGGQSPGLKGGALNAFIAAGPEDSHVSFNLEEVLDILRHGLTAILTPRPWLFGPDDFGNLAAAIESKKIDTRRIMFCTDDIQADRLVSEGHLDHVIRLAINKGIDPIMAIQMATINVAQHLRMSRDFGSISPGRMADIVILDDLEAVRADKVLVHGKMVAEKGELVEQPVRFTYPRWAIETIHVRGKVTADDLAVRFDNGASEAKVRIIITGMPKKLVTGVLPVRDGVVLPDETKDIVSIALLDRHKGTGNVGRSFIKDTGIRNGALASSVSHDGHNIWTIGSSHEYMALAVNKLIDIGGGFVAVKNGEIIGQIELPVAGLISQEPFESVAMKFKDFEKLAKEELHIKLDPYPLFTLCITPLVNLPDVGITDKGLVDSFSSEFIEPIVR